jgi:hypothetical protein
MIWPLSDTRPAGLTRYVSATGTFLAPETKPYLSPPCATNVSIGWVKLRELSTSTCFPLYSRLEGHPRFPSHHPHHALIERTEPLWQQRRGKIGRAADRARLILEMATVVMSPSPRNGERAARRIVRASIRTGLPAAPVRPLMPAKPTGAAPP